MYNEWPLGILSEDQCRPELGALRKLGYEFSDPREVVGMFERKVADFAGSQYAVAVDSCSHGLFLVLKYLGASGKVTIPSRTYVSVPMQIMHAGCTVEFEDIEWSGVYQLKPYPIWDSAVRWTKGMYIGGYQVLSFQIKKRIPIGKGGMIITDDKSAYEWLKRASYDGRDLTQQYTDNTFDMLGWHYYMTPEDAARGILLMDRTPEVNPDSATQNSYMDLSTFKVFK